MFCCKSSDINVSSNQQEVFHYDHLQSFVPHPDRSSQWQASSLRPGLDRATAGMGLPLAVAWTPPASARTPDDQRSGSGVSPSDRSERPSPEWSECLVWNNSFWRKHFRVGPSTGTCPRIRSARLWRQPLSKVGKYFSNRKAWEEPLSSQDGPPVVAECTSPAGRHRHLQTKNINRIVPTHFLKSHSFLFMPVHDCYEILLWFYHYKDIFQL